MSRASNTANIGAKLQNTTGNELSGGGNIRAVTFQGSGKLLTDILSLTGGQIIIPVGSTREYKNVQSALNSLTAYIFEDTADVQILLDDETFNETTSINLGHDYGDRITIRGQGDYNFKSLRGSPVLSVSGINTIALSATIALEPGSDVPAVGDYVNIFSVSGRDASYLTALHILDLAGGVNGLYAVGLETLPSINPVGKLRTGEGSRTINVGDVAVVTLLSGGNATTTTISQVYTVSSVAVKNYGYDRHEIRFANAPSLPDASINSALVQIGTPDSYIGNTFTQVSAGGLHVTFPEITGNYVLTFSDATPTNTYLNPGDQILALGQTRIVEAVSSNNKCFLDAPFRTGRRNLSAYNVFDSFDITTPTNYLVKTVYERYRGCHRVAAVNGTSDITIEVPDYGFFLPSMKGSTGRTAISSLPLPRYGVRSIGNAFNIIDQFSPALVQSFPQAKILKTKLDFSNINSTSVYPTLTSGNAAEGFGCLYLNNAKLRMLDNLVVLNNGLIKQHGLRVGIGLPTEIASQATMTQGTSGIGIVGTFNYHIFVTNNSTLNINNLGIGVYVRNFAQIVRTGVSAALPGESSTITYNTGCLGNVNFLTSVSPQNNFTVPTGTISNYTATNAFANNTFLPSSDSLPVASNILLQRRSSGFSETANRVGDIRVSGISLFNNNAIGTHRSFNLGRQSIISYANLIGIGNNCEGLGILSNSNYNIHAGRVFMNSGFDTAISNCLICIQGISAGYGQGTLKVGAKSPGSDWTLFYFCDYIMSASNTNTTVDYGSNAIFSNCFTLFYFFSQDCTILALNSVARNCETIVVGYGTSNYIDVVTGNQYSPPTVQIY